MNSFKGCTAVITGASAGIGREIARQLAPEAGTLILVARRADRLEELRGQLARPGLEIECRATDVSNDAQLNDLLQQLASRTTPVDLIVNNAGVGDHGLFENSEWSRIDAMLTLNIRALTRITHALLPQLVKSGNGAILNVSSIASLIPVPNMAVYAATKAYVTSFSESLRAELRGTGISVTALCPGPVPTEFFDLAERPGATASAPTPEFFRVPAEEVAREALDAVLRDRPRVIPGWIVWAVMTLATLLPLAVVRIALAQRRSRTDS